jgi:hypothetical protein
MRLDSRPGWRAGGPALVAGWLAALSVPALAQPVAKAPLRLLVWINGDKGYNGLQKVGDTFAAESGVQVVVQHPESAPDKFAAAAAAGKGPDIFCWPHDRVGEWARSGLIVPVKPPARIKAEIEDSAWQAFTFKGQIWGYPLSIESIGLIYNKALVRTPPATFDEVIALDKQFRAQGKSAILWSYNQSFFSWALLSDIDALPSLSEAALRGEDPGWLVGTPLEALFRTPPDAPDAPPAPVVHPAALHAPAARAASIGASGASVGGFMVEMSAMVKIGSAVPLLSHCPGPTRRCVTTPSSGVSPSNDL